MIDVLAIQNEYRFSKLVETTIERESGRRKKNRAYEPIQVIIHGSATRKLPV
jgi:hypothetical protein